MDPSEEKINKSTENIPEGTQELDILQKLF